MDIRPMLFWAECEHLRYSHACLGWMSPIISPLLSVSSLRDPSPHCSHADLQALYLQTGAQGIGDEAEASGSFLLA